MQDITLWLDLEGTIIESGDSPILLTNNIIKIKNFIEKNNIINVCIFSFLFETEIDIENNLSLIRGIEGIFNITFDMIFHKQMLMPLFKKKYGQMFDEFDFLDFTRSKEDCFQLFCRSCCNGTNILIDDKVENTSLIVNNKTIITININEETNHD